MSQEVLDEDLFSDGVDASEVAAELEAALLGGVVGRRAREHAVSGPVDAASVERSPLRPAAVPRDATATCDAAIRTDHCRQSLTLPSIVTTNTTHHT